MMFFLFCFVLLAEYTNRRNRRIVVAIVYGVYRDRYKTNPASSTRYSIVENFEKSFELFLLYPGRKYTNRTKRTFTFNSSFINAYYDGISFDCSRKR